METTNNEKLTVKEAAKRLGQHEQTIYRHIKDGSLKAERIPGKYGEYAYLVEIPAGTIPAPGGAVDIGKLFALLDERSQMVGYWRARAETAEAENKLLKAAPVITPPPAKRPWYKFW